MSDMYRHSVARLGYLPQELSGAVLPTRAAAVEDAANEHDLDECQQWELGRSGRCCIDGSPEIGDRPRATLVVRLHGLD